MCAAPKVDIFHVGPQKSGTTWIYECLREHAGVCCPPRDTIHYYDMFYARGPDWYAQAFAHARPGQQLFDPTPTYLRSTWAPRRMAADNPGARIIFCLRNPIERAFSHYWHEKKKLTIRFEFADCLRNYDLFQSYLETGFYAEHIARFLDHFPRSALLVQRFEQLQQDPRGFLDELLAFAALDRDFEPSILNRRRNAASPRQTLVGRLVGEVTEKAVRSLPEPAARGIQRSGAYRLLSGRREYLEGIPAPLYRELLEICTPEINRLETLLGLDLAVWKQPPPAP
ncbi:MAG: sulfotransferase [Pseudomonadota bacterium]